MLEETSFAIIWLRFENIRPIGISRERERKRNIYMSSRQRSKHQTESLAGKHQYFPRTARATNTHSIGYRWWTTRMRRWRLHSSALHDARANGGRRRRERRERKSHVRREKCPKWLLVRVTRGGETPCTRARSRRRDAVIHARHARVALLRDSYDSYEAKRRERYALPIFMLTDTDAYPPDLQLRSRMLRTKSLHALSRRGKSIDTYGSRYCSASPAHATHGVPIASHARLAEPWRKKRHVLALTICYS